MNNLPVNSITSNETNLNNLSKNALLKKCNELNITKYKSKNKDELINLINNLDLIY